MRRDRTPSELKRSAQRARDAAARARLKRSGAPLKRPNPQPPKTRATLVQPRTYYREQRPTHAGGVPFQGEALQAIEDVIGEMTDWGEAERAAFKKRMLAWQPVAFVTDALGMLVGAGELATAMRGATAATRAAGAATKAAEGAAAARAGKGDLLAGIRAAFKAHDERLAAEAAAKLSPEERALADAQKVTDRALARQRGEPDDLLRRLWPEMTEPPGKLAAGGLLALLASNPTAASYALFGMAAQRQADQLRAQIAGLSGQPRDRARIQEAELEQIAQRAATIAKQRIEQQVHIDMHR